MTGSTPRQVSVRPNQEGVLLSVECSNLAQAGLRHLGDAPVTQHSPPGTEHLIKPNRTAVVGEAGAVTHPVTGPESRQQPQMSAPSGPRR